jgi:hypothetical protein
MNAKLKAVYGNLVRVVSKVDGSVWWTSPEVAATGWHVENAYVPAMEKSVLAATPERVG